MWLTLSVSCYFISTCLLNRDSLLQTWLLAVHNRFHRLALVALPFNEGQDYSILYIWTDECVFYTFFSVIIVIFHKAFCIPIFIIRLLVVGIKPKVPVPALTANYLAVISQWAHKSHLRKQDWCLPCVIPGWLLSGSELHQYLSAPVLFHSKVHSDHLLHHPWMSFVSGGVKLSKKGKK